MNKVQKALDLLVSLIARGAEFPDAQFEVSQKYDLNDDEISELIFEYDRL